MKRKRGGNKILSNAEERLIKTILDDHLKLLKEILTRDNVRPVQFREHENNGQLNSHAQMCQISIRNHSITVDAKTYDLDGGYLFFVKPDGKTFVIREKDRAEESWNISIG